MKYTKIDNCIDSLINHYKENVINVINDKNEEVVNAVMTAVKETIEEVYIPKDIKNIYDLAKLINNNDYGCELNNIYNIDVEALCRKNKWIILFPYSDDCLEVRGYIDDEISAFNGGKYKILKKGDFYQDEYEENTYHKANVNQIIEAENDATIYMEWCPKNKNYTWDISCDYTNSVYFNIIGEEDNEIWAKCCIIDVSNICD